MKHRHDNAWAVYAIKREAKLSRADYEAAVRFEFSLPVNKAGRTLGVVDSVLGACEARDYFRPTLS